MSYRQSESIAANRMWPFVVLDDVTDQPVATAVDHTNLQRQKLGSAFANLTNNPTALTGITGAWWVELTAAELDTVGPLGLRVAGAGIRTLVSWEDVDVVGVRPDYFVGEPDATRRVFPFVVTDVPNGDPINTPIDHTNVSVYKFGAGAAVAVAANPVAVAGQTGAFELTFAIAELDTHGPMAVVISKPGTIRTIVAYVMVGPRTVAPPSPIPPAVDTTLVPVPSPIVFMDHGDAAVARLVEQFRGKPRIEAFLRALCEPMNELDQAFVDMVGKMSIDNAIGDQLEQVRKKVGQPPADVPTETMRAFIRARVRTNKSSGLGDQLLQIARLVLKGYAALPAVLAAGALRIRARNHGYAAATLEIQGVDLDWTLADYLLRSFLEVAIGIAIDVQLVFFVQHDAVYDDHSARPFLLGDAVSGDAPGGGLGDALTPTTGGVLAAVME